MSEDEYMEPESDSDEEIEFSVFVNFGSHFPCDLQDADTQMKIIGLDTKTPVAQINGRYYQGEYDLALGTKLFFGPSNEESQDEWFSKKTQTEPYEFVDKTTKVLNMKRIFITPKQKDTHVAVKEEPHDQEEKYKVQTTYSEALNKFLSEARRPPRKLNSEEDGEDLVKKSPEDME